MTYDSLDMHKRLLVSSLVCKLDYSIAVCVPFQDVIN